MFLSLLNRKSQFFIFILCSVFFNVGCVTKQAAYKLQKINIDGLIISNKTSRVVEDVRLTDLENNQFVSCNAILPNTECSLGFRKINEENHAAVITWRQGNQFYTHAVKAENAILTGETLQVHIEIYNNGKLNTYFKVHD